MLADAVPRADLTMHISTAHTLPNPPGAAGGVADINFPDKPFAMPGEALLLLAGLNEMYMPRVLYRLAALGDFITDPHL